MSLPASCGFSKFGAALKLSDPVCASIWNRLASAPPAIDQVRVVWASGSVAVSVAIAVPFSARLKLAAEVMAGDSFTSVTLTVTLWICVEPSAATAVTWRARVAPAS